MKIIRESCYHEPKSRNSRAWTITSIFYLTITSGDDLLPRLTCKVDPIMLRPRKTSCQLEYQNRWRSTRRPWLAVKIHWLLLSAASLAFCFASAAFASFVHFFLQVLYLRLRLLQLLLLALQFFFVVASCSYYVLIGLASGLAEVIRCCWASFSANCWFTSRKAACCSLNLRSCWIVACGPSTTGLLGAWLLDAGLFGHSEQRSAFELPGFLVLIGLILPDNLQLTFQLWLSVG